MSSLLPLWEIDDGYLSYYYQAQSTESGTYYTLKTPTPGLPQGFYAFERDKAMASQNQQMQMAETSGNTAKKARGKRVDDDTTLPSERIANAEYIDEVTSSGKEAQKRRKKKDK